MNKELAKSVIMVSGAISDEASGPSQSVRELCDQLVKKNWDLRLGTLDWSPIAQAPDYLSTFAIAGPSRSLGRAPSLYRWLLDSARAETNCIIHGNGLWMMPNIYVGWVSARIGRPLVVSPRGTLSEYAMRSGSRFKPLLWRALQNPVLRKVSCFHATSHSEYLDIRRLGFDQPIAVIPNPVVVDPNYVRKTDDSATDGLRTIIFLGRIHPIKGIDLLLEAWGATGPKFPGWKLRIIGTGDADYIRHLKSLIGKLSAERVSIEGPIYGKEKQRALSESEVFVLLSHSENFAMAVGEALASGTPALVSKGTPWSALPRKEAGWWIENSKETISKSLENIMSMPDSELNKMGDNGRRWMSEEFAPEKVADEFCDTYRWLLGYQDAPSCVIFD